MGSVKKVKSEISEIKAELFSEIYGTYFAVTEDILNRRELTKSEIDSYVRTHGFSESTLFLTPKLTADWGLLIKNEDGKYRSVLKHRSQMPLTNLQKSYLAAILNDKRARLFLDEGDISRLKQRLKIKPLFDISRFKIFDKFSDGDNFTSGEYIQIFRTILTAIHSREVLRISSQTGKGNRVTHYYVPLRLEYSEKNDKFRALLIRVKNGKPVQYGVFNLSRIIYAQRTGEIYSGDTDINKLFESRRSAVPAVVKVTGERNGIERFLMEFASYEKQCELDGEGDACTCTVKIFYDKNDETELLINILSFGSVAEIISPSDLREKAKERVLREKEILRNI